MPENNIKNEFDKDLLTDIVTKAVENFYQTQEVENIDKPIEDVVEEPVVVPNDLVTDNESDNIPDISTVTNEVMITDNTPVDKSIINTEIQDKVEDKIEEAIGKSDKFKFLGVDINITKNKENKFDVCIKKDDSEKCETVDSVNLDTIFGLIDSFFSDLVIDEETKSEDDKLEESKDDENKDKDNDKDKDDSEDDENEDDENEDDDDENEDEDKENEDKDIDSDLVKTKMITMSALRTKYADKVDEILEQGLEAKAIALDMVKDTILAKNVKDLLNKSKEKDSLIANKKIELETASKKYILAKKTNDEFKKAYALISQSMIDIENKLKKGVISREFANRLIKRNSVIISKMLISKKVETLIAGNKALSDSNNILVAYIKKNEKAKTIMANKNVNKNQLNNSIKKPIISSKNVFNSDGWKDRNQTLSSTYINKVDEMTADLIKIAGIDK